MKNLVKIYAVMSVTGGSMKEIFRSTDKALCREFKKDHKAEFKKLGVMWIENQ